MFIKINKNYKIKALKYVQGSVEIFFFVFLWSFDTYFIVVTQLGFGNKHAKVSKENNKKLQ